MQEKNYKKVLSCQNAPLPSSRCLPHGTLRAAKMRDIVVGGHSTSLYPGFARAASTGMTSEACGGFTLIELLVVVLIIGILAAVALPQYKKAVLKTRLATLKPMVVSISQAADAFYLTTGTYPWNQLDALDVDISHNEEISCDEYSCSMPVTNRIKCIITENSAKTKGVECFDEQAGLRYHKYSIYNHKTELAGKNVCCGTNALTQQICREDIKNQTVFWRTTELTCYKEP